MKIRKWAVLFTLLTHIVYGQGNQPWKIYYDSTQLFWAKDWNRTVGLLENAERSAVTDLGIYDENYLTILNDLGTAYWKAKKYPQAEKVLSRSLSLKTEVYPPNDKEIILSLSNLAGFYAEQGMWSKSKTFYKRILENDPANIRSDLYVGAAQNLVSLYDLNLQPDSAGLLLEKIDKWNVIPVDSYLAFQHRFYRARVHRKLQEYQSAESELLRLVRVLEERSEPELRELYIQCLQERGILFLQTGAYSQAENNLLQAYQMVTSEMNREFLLTELSNNLAQVYERLNIYDKALQYYQESLGRCRQHYADNSLPCIILLNNIAGVHLKEGNLSQAIKDYQKVINEFEKLLAASDPVYITALNNLATAYRKNNKLEIARVHLEKASKLLNKGGLANDDIAATVLNNIAVINTAEGEYEKAALNYSNAFDIKRSIYGENSVLLMDLISNLAVTYWALNRPVEAIPLFKKSIELAVRQVNYVFPNLSENEQVQFYQKLKEDFERFNTIAIQWADKDSELLSQVFQNRAIIKSLQFFTHQRRKNHIERKKDPALDEPVSRA